MLSQAAAEQFLRFALRGQLSPCTMVRLLWMTIADGCAECLSLPSFGLSVYSIFGTLNANCHPERSAGCAYARPAVQRRGAKDLLR